MKNNATNSPVLTLVYGAAIAAIYVVLTMVFLPISFGPIQFRISELLCVLPYFTPAAIPGNAIPAAHFPVPATEASCHTGCN